MLKAVQKQAGQHDFLKDAAFDELCKTQGVAMEGPGGRDSLLKFFDTLGIVIHFPNLPYLTEYVLNPRWLTYGVYSIMYSETASAAKGRIGEADVVSILKGAKPVDAGSRELRYPAERCRLIADAMTAFGVAYRLAHEQNRLVIPALLEPQQPRHNFKSDGALAFQFDFKGFLPRHVLPALIVEHHPSIARINGAEIVWQNGVLLRPNRGQDAEALIKADYHARCIDIRVQGSDAAAYLGVMRDSILRTLETMPQLPFEEKILLRPGMRTGNEARLGLGDDPVWADYESVRTAQKNRLPVIAAGKHLYDLDKVLAVMPVNPELKPADVFLSYAHKDRAIVDGLAEAIAEMRFSVWYDPGLTGGQKFRSVINQRIGAAKAVVAVWTENSVGSEWVIDEASRASSQKKLICLRAPGLDFNRIPPPFPANHHVIELGKTDDLFEAIRRLCPKRGA